MTNTAVPFETLLADLHGSDWTKRCNAARLLGQSKDPRAVEALLPDLKDSDWKVRRNAAQALGALRSQQAVDGLLEALKDRVATVRERAAVALGRIKDPRTLPALVEAVIEEKDATHFHVNEGAYQAVHKFGKKAGPHLVERLNVKQNMYVLELLAASKYEAQTDLFLTLAESPDPAIRRTALKALEKSNDPRVVDYLIRLLEKGDLESRVLAVQILGRLNAGQAAAKLLGLLVDDEIFGPQTGLYRAVCDAFQEFSGIKKELANAFPIKPGPAFNVGGAGIDLAQMMGRLGNDGFQKLNEMLGDAEKRAESLSGKFNLPPQVIQNMIERTWQLGATLADGRDAKAEQMKLLIELLKSETSLTRAAAALSLPWYADTQILASLEPLTQDQDEMVRRAATWARNVLVKMSA